jgi:hypothetical protein
MKLIQLLRLCISNEKEDTFEGGKYDHFKVLTKSSPRDLQKTKGMNG